MTNLEKRYFPALLAVLCVAACVGGSNTEVAGIDRGGVGGGGSVGVVTGFGSIFVNGTRYETDMASVTVDGRPATEGDLALGLVVAVEAEIGPGVASATAVNFDSNVIGPVSDVDAVAGSLNVLGQTVLVTTDTWFDATLAAQGLAGVTNGDVLRVSGFASADDRIVATRIDSMAGNGVFELQGVARDVDVAASTFRIGQQPIDYSSGISILGFPGGGPAEGDLVRVKGTQLAMGGAFVVDEMLRKTLPLDNQEGDEVELEGFITDFASATEFRVAGLAITTDAGTEFEYGTVADLALNVRVELEGRVLPDGRLLAEEVEFRQNGDLRIEATVESVDPVAETVTLLGILVRAAGLRHIDDLSPGECAKVGGVESSQVPGEVIASRLEDEDSCGTTLLRGYVESAADPEFTILGVTVLTDTSTNFPGGAAAFFAAAPGRLVEARGTQLGTTLLAGEVEFKD